MWTFFYFLATSGRSSGALHLQAAVQHGVGASIGVEGLLSLQLDSMFGIKPKEVYELCGGVDLRLHHRLSLNTSAGR